MTYYYTWDRNGPRDYRVYRENFWGTGHRECMSLHTSKRSAQAAVDRLNANISS